MTTEETKAARLQIQAENKEHRAYLQITYAQIKDYQKRIEACQQAIQATNKKISDNNDRFYNLGK